MGRVEVCWGGAGLVLGRCRGGVSGWVEEVGVGCVRGACVGRAWGVFVERACGVRGGNKLRFIIRIPW